MTVEVSGAMVTDPDLPAVEVLLSPAVTDVLTEAVRARGGKVTVAHPSLIDWWPGYSAKIRYEATVEWPDRASEETLAAFVRPQGGVRGPTQVEVAGEMVSVWRYPEDPYLPGVAQVTDRGFVFEMLEELGVPAGTVDIVPRSYSPRSRIVVEVRTTPVSNKLVFRPGVGLVAPPSSTLLYLKALRPEAAAQLRRAHDAVGGRAPTATCLRWYEDLGIVAMEPLEGAALWTCLESGTHPVPGGDELLGLLDLIADVPFDPSPRMPVTEIARQNAEMLARVVPFERPRLERFVKKLGPDRPLEKLTVHGDFHEMQILLGPDGVSGLLDLDDLGRGHREDDLGMLLGRLWGFAERGHAARRVAEYAMELLHAFERHLDPVELRRRMAAVALNHATTPFRFQERDWRGRTTRAIARADALIDELLPGGAPG